MEVTAEQVANLRKRHAELERRVAETRWHHEAARSAAAAMTDRMREEYGVQDLEALEARLADEDAALASEAAAARLAMDTIERMLP